MSKVPWLFMCAAWALAMIGWQATKSDLRECQMRTEQIALPPCDDCTKPQLRVWTAGNQNKLIMPRAGNGPAPHID